jgi:hypothetical protein
MNKKYRLELSLIVVMLLPFSYHKAFSWEYPFRSAYLFHLGVPISKVEPELAKREEMGTSGAGIELGFGYHFMGFLNIGSDVGFEYYDDKNEFTQSTTAGDRTSEIHMPYVSLFVGYRLLVIPVYPGSNFGFSAALSGGRQWMVNTRRTIDNCSGCSSESISVEGGYFMESEVNLGYIVDRYMFVDAGVSYRHYLSGSDFVRRFIIKIGVISKTL